jgi:hypothetical protein
VSCKTISKEEFDKTIPVSPPTVNKNTNPKAHSNEGVKSSQAPWNVPTHLKILIPVGTAIIIVAVVKYARVSASIPTVNIWCAHTTNPSTPIASIA